MPFIQEEIDSILAEVASIRKNLAKIKTAQVRSADEKRVIKAVCYAWLKKHRGSVIAHIDGDAFSKVDDLYGELLKATDVSTARSKYLNWLKVLHMLLSNCRQSAISRENQKLVSTTDTPPKFDKLVPDPKMQRILTRRWLECTICVKHGASLAAIVMTGGLVEGLLLARINRESDKTKIFKSKYAPKDKKTGKALPLGEDWKLKNYIDVAHDLGWITRSAKDVSIVVRDYRNYIHPQKELSHGIHLEEDDARMFWEIAKQITRQILK